MSGSQSDRPVDLGDVARQSPEASTRSALEELGDVPDAGDVTSADNAQHAPDDGGTGGDDSPGLLGAPSGVEPS